MRLDRQNTLVVCVATVALFAIAMWAAVTANGKADEKRTEQVRLQRDKVTACETVEDEMVRALCLAAVGEDAGR